MQRHSCCHFVVVCEFVCKDISVCVTVKYFTENDCVAPSSVFMQISVISSVVSHLHQCFGDFCNW